MELKIKIKDYYKMIDKKFLDQFGFRIKETSFSKIVKYLHEPKDSSSLAVTRILFGLAMLIDIPSERGGSTMDLRWGGKLCHFPLVPFITAIPMPYMAIVYAALWLGALGIMLGYMYRIASVLFTVCYWYLFLIEKSYWNNHSYLFGLVAFLLSFTEANCFWSLDVYLEPSKKKLTVPYWNYFLLKYQFFILYFMAGLKKGSVEWLSGYSMMELSKHWVFDPFKLFLTVPQIDYLIVHWFIFVFDLTVAMWMMWARTRHVAMVFCAMFHLMNSRLFTIGMFPWVCLATMPLFCPFDWPKTIGRKFKEQFMKIKELTCYLTKIFYNYRSCNCKTKEDEEVEDNIDCFEDIVTKTDEDCGYIKNSHNIKNNDEQFKEDMENTDKVIQDQNTHNDNVRTNKVTGPENEKIYLQKIDDKDETSRNISKPAEREKLTTCLIFIYVFIQAFLPYSHFITKGYNNWTNGLYGYSWDMMVHSWYSESVTIRIVDNDNDEESFINPDAFAPNARWISHGDMAYQYAHCLYPKLLNARPVDRKISENLSMYFDVWTSLNHRFTQRMFDPTADMLKVTWSPLKTVSFFIPLLDEASHWRSTLQEITEEIYSWSNKSDVIFFANLPTHEHEKYIPEELSNVSLTVLKGLVAFEPETTSTQLGQTFMLTSGNRIAIHSNTMNKVNNIGISPAYYMYTFVNSTKKIHEYKVKPKLPIYTELYERFQGMVFFASVVGQSLFQILRGCNGQC